MRMRQLADSECGALVPIGEGLRAFVPDPLPRELRLSPPLAALLDRASRAVARLDGVGETVPNPHLFIQPLIRREAQLSSRIEGTRASLSDVFSYEAGSRSSAEDVQEVVNYIDALECGIDALASVPISFRLANQVHARLLAGVRGGDGAAGAFRRIQVYIAPPAASVEDAAFIPPPPEMLRDLFQDWERFVNEPADMPPLVKCALMHYQIEAIHPYEDGNGRIGRLLIALFLIASGVLSSPLLYLSAYFERDRQRYYDELFAVSQTCDWERWLRYFLTGALRESRDAVERIRRIRGLQDRFREIIETSRQPISSLRLMERMCASPFVTVRGAAEILEMTVAGARRVLERLESAGLVSQVDGAYPALYAAYEVLEALEAPIDLPDDM